MKHTNDYFVFVIASDNRKQRGLLRYTNINKYMMTEVV